MQTPNLVTGQIVKQPETDLIMAAIRSVKQLVLDLLLKQLNAIIPGGFALTAAAGTPIVVTYAQGVVVLSGYDIAVPAGSLTVGAANATFHRYDLLTVAYSQTSPTDSAGQATTLDTATPTVVAGTPSASPVLPALPAGSVQLGWIDVPPGVTSAQQCTLHQTAADKGPLLPNDLADLTTHLAASMATAVVHGFQATTPGGIGKGMLAQTDGTYGAVGAALTAVDSGGVLRLFAAPGNGTPFYFAAYDASGRVANSELLQGNAASAFDAAGSAGAVQTNLNNHAASGAKTAVGVHGLIVDSGGKAAQSVGNQSFSDFSIAFSYAQPDTNYRVITQWVVSTPFTVEFGGATQVWNKTTTGCSVRVAQNSGATQSIGLDWWLVR